MLFNGNAVLISQRLKLMASAVILLACLSLLTCSFVPPSGEILKCTKAVWVFPSQQLMFDESSRTAESHQSARFNKFNNRNIAESLTKCIILLQIQTLRAINLKF